MPSHCNDLSAGGCMWLGGAAMLLQRRGGNGEVPRGGGTIHGREGRGESPQCTIHQSFAPTCSHSACPLPICQGKSSAHYQEAALETPQQAWGFHTLLQRNDKAELPCCSRDGTEEARPAQGDSWDWGQSLKWLEKASSREGSEARHTQALGGEVRMSSGQGERWANNFVCQVTSILRRDRGRFDP